MGEEPRSLGRVAFDAWMAGDVVAANGKGGWTMIHPRAESWTSHWYALLPSQRETWERIAAAVRDHLEAGRLGPTYLIEVD